MGCTETAGEGGDKPSHAFSLALITWARHSIKFGHDGSHQALKRWGHSDLPSTADQTQPPCGGWGEEKRGQLWL